MNLTRVIAPFVDVKMTHAASRAFEGYGSVFGVLDSYADVVQKGAFARSLREFRTKGRMPALLWQHDSAKPIGVYESMVEDDNGLFVKGRLSDTQLGREAYALLQDGALSGLSIGFLTKKSEFDDETGIRTLTDVDLWETSLVTFPANDAARVTDVKGAALAPVADAIVAILTGDLTVREAERTLREAGFTREQAKHVISKGYRDGRREAMPSRDACGELLALVNQRVALSTGDRV